MQQPVTGGSMVRPVNVGTRVERIDRKEGTFVHSNTMGMSTKVGPSCRNARQLLGGFCLPDLRGEDQAGAGRRKAGQLTCYVNYDDRVFSFKKPPRIGRKKTSRLLTDKD